LKIYYKNYCKILSKVIILAKKKYYNNKLANSTNKPKTPCIIKTITNNKRNPNDILMRELDGKITTHHQTIAEDFNNYYASVADVNNNNPVKILLVN